jgi:hypothetical protein
VGVKRPRKVRIERLVLHGFEPAQAARVAEALRAGLERRLAGASPAARPGDAGAAAAEQLMQRLPAADKTPRGGRT